MNKNYCYILALASVLSLSSCDSIRNIFTKGDSNKVQKEVVLPQDREAIASATNTKMYSPEEFKKGIIKGDWAIETVFGKEAIGQNPPYIKFAEDKGRIYGNNGCNTINGEYRYNAADSTLRFDNVAVTMMLCSKEGITDYLINQALNDARSYSLSESEDSYILCIFDASGKQIMELAHQNLDFLNGTWKVTAIDGEKVNIEKMKLVFDIDENKVHGNTGCNVLNGRLETDLDAPNTFSFESMAVTMMMCPEIEYQTAMLVALEDACRAKPIDQNKVELLDSSGKAVITLERTSDR